jgi:hypothetical protein
MHYGTLLHNVTATSEPTTTAFFRTLYTTANAANAPSATSSYYNDDVENEDPLLPLLVLFPLHETYNMQHYSPPFSPTMCVLRHRSSTTPK